MVLHATTCCDAVVSRVVRLGGNAFTADGAPFIGSALIGTPLLQTLEYALFGSVLTPHTALSPPPYPYGKSRAALPLLRLQVA